MSQARGSQGDWYEVESICGDRVTTGIKEYLVRWVGYGPDADEYVFVYNMRALELIRDYERSKRAQRCRRRRQSDSFTSDVGGDSSTSVLTDDLDVASSSSVVEDSGYNDQSSSAEIGSNHIDDESGGTEDACSSTVSYSSSREENSVIEMDVGTCGGSASSESFAPVDAISRSTPSPFDSGSTSSGDTGSSSVSSSAAASSSQRLRLQDFVKSRAPSQRMPKSSIRLCRKFLADVYDVILHIIRLGPLALLDGNVYDGDIRRKLKAQWREFLYDTNLDLLAQFIISHLEDAYLRTAFEVKRSGQVSRGAQVHLITGVLICIAGCHYDTEVGRLLKLHLQAHHVDLARCIHNEYPHVPVVVTPRSLRVGQREVQALHAVLESFCL